MFFSALFFCYDEFDWLTAQIWDIVPETESVNHHSLSFIRLSKLGFVPE